MIFIFFNLLVNSILSLAISLIIVYFFIWFFRVEVGRWKLFLLSLPFAKIIYDFIRGVPEKSVLFSGVDPFGLPPRHQLLSIGAGFDGWTPFISTVFSVNALDGNTYHSSLGDYFLFWTQRTFGETFPILIVISVLTVSFTLLADRLIQYYRFEKKRREDRASLFHFKRLNVGLRTVDIYISSYFLGTPFTGGVISPYICLPLEATQKLNADELNAVIAHELGHVRYYDLVVTILIQALGDLFWFIPGYRWLSRKIDCLREIVADNWAISLHYEPHFLASALLKLSEISEKNGRFVFYSAFFREKSLLKERIERLVGRVKERKPRFGWQNRWLRYAVAIFISLVVLNSVFGGNFKSDEVRQAPEWVENLLKVSCLCAGHVFYAIV